MVRKQLDIINNEIIKIIKDYVNENKIIEIKNVSNAVYSRSETNVGINTDIANLYDIQQLLEDNASKYEDGGIGFDNNILDTNGKGFIGIETLITIDSGNNASSQNALSEHGFVLIQLYNFIKTKQLPPEWKLYDIEMDKPSWHPFHSGNIYSIIIIKGIYEIK